MEIKKYGLLKEKGLVKFLPFSKEKASMIVFRFNSDTGDKEEAERGEIGIDQVDQVIAQLKEQIARWGDVKQDIEDCLKLYKEA